jgi:endonuclease YncB( thermonuclease family)
MNKEQLDHLKLATDDTPEFTLEDTKTLCKVVDVYDGDTVKVVFYYKDELLKWTVRLYGINTPELRPSRKLSNRDEIIRRGKEARDYVISKCKETDNMIYLHCLGNDKYGRLLGILYIDDSYTLSINDLLLKNNHAIEYMR